MEEGQRDLYECTYQSQSLPRTPQSTTTGPTGIILYSDPTLGWGDAIQATRMRDLCMRARGYMKD